MTLKEHIDNIRKRLEQNIFKNEAAVRQGIVNLLLIDLGWPTEDTSIVFPEYPVENRHVDYALCPTSSTPSVLIEAKGVGKIDERAEKQLFEYAFHEGVPIIILTDGREWHFFYPIGQGNYRKRRVYELDLIERDSKESAERLNRYLNYKSIGTGDAVSAIEEDYRNVSQRRQVEEKLPEAWNKLIEEKDEFLLHALAEKTESLCEYKPTDEQVLIFLKNLERKTESHQQRTTKSSSTRETLLSDGTRKQYASSKRLIVTMPDGEKIDHDISTNTFVEVIEKLGIERIKRLGRKVRRIPLISTLNHSTYGQRKLGQYYIMTNTSTKEKKDFLRK